MLAGKYNVVTDGMWGSCGKGAIATYLALRHRPDIISTTNMPNAGHTAVFEDERKFIAKAIPSGSILNQWIPEYHPHIVIGATAAFHLGQMLKEIDECNVGHAITIHPRAGVVTDDHKAAEGGEGSNSTKHLASTMQGSGAFLSDKIMRKPGLRLARDYEDLKYFMPENNMGALYSQATRKFPGFGQMPLHRQLNLLLSQGTTILHEGSQGFSLDINHGSHYPYCTSRGTTAVNNLADMGIAPQFLGDVYLVIRPYPIRVGNVVENGVEVGNSGGCYDDHEEITWDRVAEESGMPEKVAQKLFSTELTTVTKRLRRVYSFSPTQVAEAAAVNGATKIALNFANYIDWSCYGCNDAASLPPKVMRFIRKIENITGLPVTHVGTGPRTDQVCITRAWA